MNRHKKSVAVSVVDLIASATQMAADISHAELVELGVRALETGDVSELEALVETASDEAWRVARQRVLRETFAMAAE
jgi:hypothetical protein